MSYAMPCRRTFTIKTRRSEKPGDENGVNFQEKYDFHMTVIGEDHMNQEEQQAIEVGCGIAANASSFTAGVSAVQQALSAVHLHSVSAVLVFASVVYNLDEVLQGIHSVVGDVPVLGTTTAGEICNEIRQGTVMVTVLASPFLRIHCGMGRNVSGNWRLALDEAIHSPDVQPFFDNRSEYRREMRRKGKDAFVILFSPGNTSRSDCHSYAILEALKKQFLGDIPVVGGCAADDWRMEENYILYGRQAYTDSLLIAVFETELQFGISLTHGFQPADKKATVTAVDGYEVLTLDGATAADVYTRLTDISGEDVQDGFLTYATGATIGISEPMGQHSVNIASRFTPRGGIRLTQPVSVGTVFTRMEPDPERMVLAGEESIRRAIIRGGITEAAVGIIFYCALRPRIMGDMSRSELAGMKKILSGKPLVGFCSFGELGLADDGVSRYNSSAVACLVLGSRISQTARITFENNELLAEVELQKELLVKTNEKLLREICERKRIETALRESEAKLEDFAQAVPDISMIIDEDGRYIEVFGKNGRIRAQSAQEYKGKELVTNPLLPEEDAGLMFRQIRQTLASGIPQCVVRELEFEGEKRFVEQRTVPMGYLAGGKRTVAVVVTDVSERWKAERMLKLAYELRRKSDFLNDVITGNRTIDAKAAITAKTLGIDIAVPLFCCLLAIDGAAGLAAENGEPAVDRQMLKNSILDLLTNDPTYIVWDCRDDIGVLYQTQDTKDARSKSMQLASCFQEKIRQFDPGLKFIIGVSDTHTGPRSIEQGYRQAWSAIASARCQGKNGGDIIHFRSLGILQILANLGGKEQANEFVQEKIGRIIDYDEKRGTQLLFTLDEILQSNNLKDVADKLYLHHKTIAFRKRRIEKILGVSIDDFETKIALAAAVKLYKLDNTLSYSKM